MSEISVSDAAKALQLRDLANRGGMPGIAQHIEALLTQAGLQVPALNPSGIGAANAPESVQEKRIHCVTLAVQAGVPHEILLSFATTLEEWLQRPTR